MFRHVLERKICEEDNKKKEGETAAGHDGNLQSWNRSCESDAKHERISNT